MKVDLSVFESESVEYYKECGYSDEKIFEILSEEEGINDYDEDVETEGWVDYLKTKGLITE